MRADAMAPPLVPADEDHLTTPGSGGEEGGLSGEGRGPAAAAAARWGGRIFFVVSLRLRRGAAAPALPRRGAGAEPTLLAALSG